MRYNSTYHSARGKMTVLKSVLRGGGGIDLHLVPSWLRKGGWIYVCIQMCTRTLS